MHQLIEFGMSVSAIGYIQFNRDVPNQNSFLTSETDVTLEGCLAACGIRTSCRSLTYRRTSAHCRLYGTTVHKTVISTGVIYSGRAWWTHSRVQRSFFCDVKCPAYQNCGHPRGITCNISECTSPINITKSKVYGNFRTKGAKIRYECIDGYAPNNGSDVSTCLSDGSWDRIGLLCEMDGFRRTRVGFYTKIGAFIEGLYGPAVYVNTSRSKCLSYCRNETRYCEAVSYFQENATCSLSNAPNALVEAKGWEVIVKIFPVHIHIGPGGRYSLSFKEAINYCITKNTSIASRDDLLVAYGMGFNAGQCCWVAEGYAFLALHYENPMVSSHWGIHRCTYRKAWDVFCLNPLYDHSGAD